MAKPKPKPSIQNDQTPKMSAYEQSRQKTIKSNLEKMQKLGLFDLSLKLNSFTNPKRRDRPRNSPSSPKYSSPYQLSGPPRRSSRLHDVTPVSYSEAAMVKWHGVLKDKDVRLEEGSKPEVYTEEHEKLLGNTERSWTFFVDGYGTDGRRIYDQIKGKTCHQCRQKTLGYRTHCSECQKVQGQFCGDCLYMRYGEHVLEAIENRNWICPVCRGICNCSLCRQAKGWAPTGPLYRKIASLGYKSVAHFLIQTRRSQNPTAECTVTGSQGSAKRSLPFSDMETPSNRSPQINDKLSGPLTPQSKDAMCNESKSLILVSGVDFLTKPIKIIKDKQGYEDFVGEEEKQLQSIDKEHDSSNIGGETCQLRKKKQAFGFELVPDSNSIAARVRQRRQKTIGYGGAELKEEEPHAEDNKHTDMIAISEGNQMLKKKSARSAEHDPDSTGGRLRQRRRMSKGYDDEVPGANEQNISTMEEAANISKKLLSSITKPGEEQHAEDNKHTDIIAISEGNQMLKKKSARTAEHDPDSIGGRLRQRHRMSKGYDDEVPEANEQNISTMEEAADISKRLLSIITKPGEDSIGGRLRQGRRMSKGCDDEVPEANKQNISTIEEVAGISEKLSSSLTEPGEDSIARRLRSRQKLT